MKKKLREKFRREFFDCVYTTLVDRGGAVETMRKPFIDYHMDESIWHHEWRFSGMLGFGGKYRKDRNAIDCYQEDETPQRMKLIEEINEELEAFKRVYKEAFKRS